MSESAEADAPAVSVRRKPSAITYSGPNAAGGRVSVIRHQSVLDH
jgi:hypothetical protein